MQYPQHQSRDDPRVIVVREQYTGPATRPKRYPIVRPGEEGKLGTYLKLPSDTPTGPEPVPPRYGNLATTHD